MSPPLLPDNPQVGIQLTTPSFILTEEMDVIFGSEGTAASDHERHAEITQEIGLDAALARIEQGNGEPAVIGEKVEVKGSIA